MKPLPYYFSALAVADIDEIWKYTSENWSVEQANRYYQLIDDEIEYICLHPESGKPLDDFRVGFRLSKVKSHLIVYQIRKHGIYVARILHQSMDLTRQLRKL